MTFAGGSKEFHKDSNGFNREALAAHIQGEESSIFLQERYQEVKKTRHGPEHDSCALERHLAFLGRNYGIEPCRSQYLDELLDEWASEIHENKVNLVLARMGFPCLPSFSGVNPYDWVEICEEFFEINPSLEAYKYSLLVDLLTGKAREWFLTWSLSSDEANWDEFVDALYIRFEDEEEVRFDISDGDNEKVDEYVVESCVVEDYCEIEGESNKDSDSDTAVKFEAIQEVHSRHEGTKSSQIICQESGKQCSKEQKVASEFYEEIHVCEAKTKAFMVKDHKCLKVLCVDASENRTKAWFLLLMVNHEDVNYGELNELYSISEDAGYESVKQVSVVKKYVRKFEKLKMSHFCLDVGGSECGFINFITVLERDRRKLEAQVAQLVLMRFSQRHSLLILQLKDMVSNAFDNAYSGAFQGLVPVEGVNTYTSICHDVHGNVEGEAASTDLVSTGECSGCIGLKIDVVFGHKMQHLRVIVVPMESAALWHQLCAFEDEITCFYVEMKIISPKAMFVCLPQRRLLNVNHGDTSWGKSMNDWCSMFNDKGYMLMRRVIVLLVSDVFKNIYVVVGCEDLVFMHCHQLLDFLVNTKAYVVEDVFWVKKEVHELVPEEMKEQVFDNFHIKFLVYLQKLWGKFYADSKSAMPAADPMPAAGGMYARSDAFLQPHVTAILLQIAADSTVAATVQLFVASMQLMTTTMLHDATGLLTSVSAFVILGSQLQMGNCANMQDCELLQKLLPSEKITALWTVVICRLCYQLQLSSNESALATTLASFSFAFGEQQLLADFSWQPLWTPYVTAGAGVGTALRLVAASDERYMLAKDANLPDQGGKKITVHVLKSGYNLDSLRESMIQRRVRRSDFDVP